MRSVTTSQFWRLYALLPEETQNRADRAYKLWQLNPQAHGLFFKRVGKRQPVYSFHIDRDYRALGFLNEGNIVWFWIGPHEEYELLLKKL